MDYSSDFVRFIIAYNAGRPIEQVAFYDRAANQTGRHNAMRSIFAQTAQTFARAQGWHLVSPPDSVCFIEVGSPRYKKRAVLGAILQRPEVDTVAVVAIDKLSIKEPALYRELVGRVGAAGKNLIIMQDELAVVWDDQLGFAGAFHLYLMGELSEDLLLRGRNYPAQGGK